MSRDPEFRAKDKKTHKMTRDGLVERNEATGEESRISQRGQDFQLRQAPAEQPGMTPDTGRAQGGGRSHRPAAPQPEAGAAPDSGVPDRAADMPLRPETPATAHSRDAPASTPRRQSQHTGDPAGGPEATALRADQPARDSAPRATADHPSRLQYDDARSRDASGAAPRQRGTRYHQQITPEAAQPESGAAGDAAKTDAPKAEADSSKGSKLNFAPDELPPEPVGKKLTKARRKAERTGEKLEKARDNLPTKRKPSLAKELDPEKGKMTRRLHFEKEDGGRLPVKSRSAHVKGPVPLRPVHAAKNAGIGYAHKKMYEVQHENVGTEAAHKGETLAEGGLRAAWRAKKTAPYRKVARLQKKATKTSARAAYQQALHDNPKLKSNMLSRMWQKRKIKRQYAKAAREAQRAAKAAKRAGTVVGRAGQAVVAFVKSHPAIFGIAAGLLLLVMIITSMFSSCSNMGMGGMGAIMASTYLAEDQDIDNAELYYTEWETDLLLQVENAESDYPGYDEYRYSVDDVGHDPYELMAFLTAAYQDFSYADVQALLRQIFDEQYSLEFVPEVEIRTRTVTYYDEYGDPYDVEEEYEWHILNVNLTSRSFTELVTPRMSADEQQIYDVLMQTYGNRQYIENVFDFNWLPYVSCYYGYRVHPITGEKDYHKAVDIAVPTGTEILAGHDGVVTTATSHDSYGLYVAIEGTLPTGQTIVTKYAHCSQLLVSVGQQVSAGDVIAKVGSTGQSTGPHLHLEVIVDGQYLNPLYFAITGDDGSGRLPPGTPGGPEIPPYPGAPMGDGSYAALMEEAQKHLGKPYVFGAKGPDKFDCSGFVCWSLTHSGVKSIQTNAQGLYNACTPVSRENAQPGDLIFFHSTYSTSNTVTHVGIYIGNGQMIHAGKPISYASIDTRYWQEHFYAFGRI